jgi:outer membrane protein assembly factor BamB
MTSIRIGLGAMLVSGLLLVGASAQTPIGWRTDGTGRYMGVQPPTEWAEGKNVLWKTKLPGRSQGSPIVLGEKVFVVSDPAEVLCVNAADGAILWRRSNALEDLYTAEKAKEITADYGRLRGQRRDLERDLGKAKGDPNRQKELKQQLEAINRDYRSLMQRFPFPPSYADGETTHSAATPASDGTHVYAVFANGVVCAYTLAGERRWIKFLQTPTIGFGHGSSPALADGKLIIHLNDLFALDAGSGEVAWRVSLGARHASPLVAMVGEMRVVISPSGAVVRMADGKVLLKDGALSSSECSAVVNDGIVYGFPGGARAVRLLPSGQDAVKLEKLWEARTAGGRRTPSPVLHARLLYAVTTDGILDVVDAANGDLVYRKRLGLGNVYSSATVAGEYLYLSGTQGTTLVIAPGREYRQVTQNKVEGFGSCPVFSGRRLFLRTRQHLYCIGQ